jgi:hypothetical protein
MRNVYKLGIELLTKNLKEDGKINGYFKGKRP